MRKVIFATIVILTLFLMTMVSSGQAAGPSDPSFGWNSPCFDTGWLSANIGPVPWQIPTWDGGAAFFKSKGYFVTLRYPGTGTLIVWIGSGPVEINGTNANLLFGRAFDEASFHCSTSTVQTAAASVPSFFASSQEVANWVGGNPNSWFRPDPENYPQVWKYLNKGNFVQLFHPCGSWSLDYWDNGVVTTAQQGNLPVLVDEATLKSQ